MRKGLLGVGVSCILCTDTTTVTHDHLPRKTSRIGTDARSYAATAPEFWQTHPDAERPLKAWLAIVRLKRYSSPPAVREDFASASFLGQWRTVFNIGGNKYRLVVDMRYDLGRIYIRQVLTHEEYTRLTQDGSL